VSFFSLFFFFSSSYFPWAGAVRFLFFPFLFPGEKVGLSFFFFFFSSLILPVVLFLETWVSGPLFSFLCLGEKRREEPRWVGGGLFFFSPPFSFPLSVLFWSTRFPLFSHKRTEMDASRFFFSPPPFSFPGPAPFFMGAAFLSSVLAADYRTPAPPLFFFPQDFSPFPRF